MDDKKKKAEEIDDELISDEELEDSEAPDLNKQDDEVEQLTNQLKRALADYQNLEKRISGEKAAWIMSANRDLIMRLLPGLDSLLLAEMHTEDTGVKMSIKHFMDIFESEGVKRIKTEGEEFDPNTMEAVSTKEGKDGKVIEEVKAGYTLNGEVLRVAQVVVGNGN
ncbi:MAG: nucleotide exchange factor GrpE [Bacteroidia bacterium]|nr:MAG: nucleotide exchange factor GrpE [Bacteroidia bacterium]